jgi:hypothetical protein
MDEEIEEQSDEIPRSGTEGLRDLGTEGLRDREIEEQSDEIPRSGTERRRKKGSHLRQGFGGRRMG